MLCHAESPAAVAALVEAVRFSFRGGLRGAGGHVSAASIWGVSPAEYLELADPWPLNPDGELLIGLKIENRRALDRAEETTRASGSSAPAGRRASRFSRGRPGTPSERRSTRAYGSSTPLTRKPPCGA